MHISKFDNAISVTEAIAKIKCNHDTSFIWYPVVNKHGAKFEVGGRNLKGKDIELKAYIPYYTKSGEIKVYAINDFATTQVEIGYNLHINVNDGFNYHTANEFINILNNKDFRKMRVETEYNEVIESSYEREKVLSFK